MVSKCKYNEKYVWNEKTQNNPPNFKINLNEGGGGVISRLFVDQYRVGLSYVYLVMGSHTG